METREENPAELLLERLPLVTYVLRLEAPSPVLYVSPQVEQIFGFVLADFEADPEFWRKRIHDDDRSAADAAMSDMRTGEGAMVSEYRVRGRDGDAVWVRDTARVVDGCIHGYLVDITHEKELERELASARAALDAFFREAPVGLAITDPDGRYLRINDELAQTNGLAVDDHLGRTLAEVAPELAAVVDPLRARAAEPATFPVDVEVDGETRHKLVTFFPFTVGGERYDGRVVIDVTEQRRAEAAERQFRLLLEQLPLVAYVNHARPTRRVSYVSPRIEELTGYPPQAFVDDPALGDKMIHPDDFGTIIDLERDARNTPRVFEHEYRIVRADGAIRWVLDRMETVYDSFGDPLYEQGFLVDVTESHEMANLLRAVWDGALEAMVIADDEGRYIDANPAACELFGRTYEDLMSLHVWEATGSPPAVWKEFVRRGASAGESVAIRPDGSRRELEGMARANVLPGRHLAVLRDVTERKELERELWRVQKLESVGRLAGGVAHDFNNLLTAIRGYAQLLEARTSVGSVEHHHAREIDRVADRAASLTAQLLALGRRQTMNVRPLDLNRRLEQMQESIVELAGDEIHVSFDLDPTLRPVRVDAGLLGQAVLNLVGNAVDAMPGGGHMLVRTANADVAGRDDLADGSYVVVSVHDEGVGIDPETLEHVFEPFFTTKAFGEGSGLGLASAYGTVRQSGGTITVDSTPGSGSTFSIWLPEATAASTGQPRPSAGETVLVIERDPAVRDVLFETLTDAGYRVLTTRTAVDAQRLIERYEDGIDLAIADLDHVRADALAGSAVRLLRLEKPFTPTRLHGAVRAALDDGLAVAG